MTSQTSTQSSEPSHDVLSLNRTSLFTGVAVVIFLALLTALLTVLHLRQEAVSRTQASTQNLVQSVEMNIEGLIGTVDVALLGAVDEIESQLATGHPDKSAISRYLMRQKGHLTNVAYLRASNEHGDVIYGTDVGSAASSNADRDYFMRLRDDAHASLFIAKPVFGRITNQWIWIFARRINKPDGSFGGTVFSVMLMDQLESLLEQIKLDPGIIALRDSDFGLITRYPQINGSIKIPIGDRRLSTPFVDTLKANPRQGSYTSGATSIDDINRTHSYRVSEKYGFSVNIGVPLDSTLKQWRQQASIILGLTAAFVIALVAFAVLIRRSWVRQEMDVVVLKANRQSLHEAQELAGLGHYTYHLSTNTWISSDILDGIFGIKRDFLRDKENWLHLVAPESRTPLQSHLHDVVEQRRPFDHEYRIIRPNDGMDRWVHGKGKLKLDSQGNPESLTGTIQDITERKHAEQQQRIAAIAFESQEGMFITDATQTIVRVNQAFTDITGYSTEEAVGQKPKLLRSGHHDAAFYAAMMESIKIHNTWQGEIWNRRKNGELYPEWLTITQVKNNTGETTHYVATLIDITVRKTAENEIKNLAFYDPLTRLPNRRLMIDRLGQALTSSARHHRHGAVMLLDLDNFKTLNDTLGHAVGDQLLLEVAARLTSSIREGDTVARLGGDEFVVILEDLDQAGLAALQAESVAHKILDHLSVPYLLDIAVTGSTVQMRTHHCTSSIGIALFRDTPITVDELIKRADTAMYQAKAAGRNTLRFFDPEMQAVVTARASLEAELREAVQSKQFVLYYQTQVTSEDRVTGVEVMVRWQHPQRGIVLPAEFIHVAEETGLILPLGQWVLETACNQLAQWAKQPALAHLTVAVNVSAKQFHQDLFVDQVLEMLDRSAINPQRLKLELTESLMVKDVEDIIAKMASLKAKGVGFSLDDFGTGYSSLLHLQRLPLDQLKIDQGFVRNIVTDSNDAAIAKMVMALAESLGLSVIAEGVELQAQVDVLAHLGCHADQGYLFSRPLPLAAFEVFLRDAQEQAGAP